jgi:hypothetical protein
MKDAPRDKINLLAQEVGKPEKEPNMQHIPKHTRKCLLFLENSPTSLSFQIDEVDANSQHA